MEKTTTLEEFYRKKLGILPSDILKRTGQFNVFRLQEYFGSSREMPYSRKDYYKISLISGANTVHYADKTLEVENNMLLVANPQIPYNWEPLSQDKTGAFCVFTEDFMNGFGNFKEYPIFQNGGTPILSLNNAEFQQLSIIYEKMFSEINSAYVYKYDLLRNMVFELIHAALKLQPATLQQHSKTESNAGDRIASLFLELLARQFPIENPFQQIQFKSPGEFANQLNIHPNHLNRVLKEATGKTTSKIISERIAQEARTLLKHTNWNIAEISWCLGFEDPSYFIKFFKKESYKTPGTYRNA